MVPVKLAMAMERMAVAALAVAAPAAEYGVGVGVARLVVDTVVGVMVVAGEVVKAVVACIDCIRGTLEMCILWATLVCDLRTKKRKLEAK